MEERKRAKEFYQESYPNGSIERVRLTTLDLDQTLRLLVRLTSAEKQEEGNFEFFSSAEEEAGVGFIAESDDDSYRVRRRRSRFCIY